MTQPEFGVNFNGATISFSSMALSNILVLIGASFYWANIDFDTYAFGVGIIASLCNTMGLSFMN